MSADMTAIVADLHLEPDNETELLHAFEETLELITEHDPSELVILCDVVQESRPIAACSSRPCFSSYCRL